jgi:hypothetical protein
VAVQLLVDELDDDLADELFDWLAQFVSDDLLELRRRGHNRSLRRCRLGVRVRPFCGHAVKSVCLVEYENPA